MTTNRRNFIKLMGGGLAGLGLSSLAGPLSSAQAALPDPGQATSWRQIRQDYFSLDPQQIYCNCSTLGPTLKAVSQEMAAIQELFSAGISLDRFLRSIVFAISPLRQKMQALVQAPDDPASPGRYVSLVCSVTEGMSLVANGLSLGPGDAVLTTDHEHSGGYTMWELLRDRRGVNLVEVPLLVEGQPEDEWQDDLVAHFQQALGQYPVKAVSFSYLTTSTGHVLPVARLCALARERGVISVVDAAQAFAVLPLEVAALDCDFMVMNGHKYLCGPPGSGFLCIHPRQVEGGDFWPTIVDDNYYHPQIPARNYPARKGGMRAFTNLLPLSQALDFYQALGPEAVHMRLLALGRWLRIGLSRYPQVFELITPQGDGLSCSMTCFRIKGRDSEEIYQALFDQYAIQAKHSSEGGADAVRLAPHYFNTQAEMETVAQAVCALAGVDPALWHEGNALESDLR